jgi:hypothetical protein
MAAFGFCNLMKTLKNKCGIKKYSFETVKSLGLLWNPIYLNK